MKTYSFIDFGLQDFLRTVSDMKPLKIRASSFEEAAEWLLKNGHAYGWTNGGVRYWCWEEEGGDK